METRKKRLTKKPKKGNTQNDQVALLHRRRMVAKMYMEGMSQIAIADELGHTQGLISKDLTYIREQWKKDCERDFKDKLAEELERLRALEAKVHESIKLEETVWGLKDGKRIPVGKRSVDPSYFNELRKIYELRLRAMGALSGPQVNILNNNAGGSIEDLFKLIQEADKAAKDSPIEKALLDYKPSAKEDESLSDEELEKLDEEEEIEEAELEDDEIELE